MANLTLAPLRRLTLRISCGGATFTSVTMSVPEDDASTRLKRLSSGIALLHHVRMRF
jgi:hypothetical protein